MATRSPPVSRSSADRSIEADGGGAVTFAAPDGFPLGRTLRSGTGDGPLVLVSGATAVPHRYYAGFAEALTEAGARAVLTYDYRGIGASPTPAHWRGRLNMKDWALQDFAAAIDRLDAVAPDHPMVGIGQSFGGQALGLSDRSDRFARYAIVASMSGATRLLDDRWAWPRMNLLGVPVTRVFGEIPRWMGLGEPIPGSIFRDWARWCRMPNYFFDDPDLPETKRFASIDIPLLTLGMTDDPWGTPRAVAHLMKHYSNARIEERWIAPQDAGVDRIGHLGFFRPRFRDSLWPDVIDWLVGGSRQ